MGDDLRATVPAITSLLALAAEPLPLETLAVLLADHELIGQPDGLDLLEDALRHGSVMLCRARTATDILGYTLYHESYRQHILNSERIRRSCNKARARLCDLAINWSKLADGSAQRHYALQFGATHLIKAGICVELEKLLCDLSFIQAKCAAEMTYELVGDYNAALNSTTSQSKRVSEFSRYVRGQSHILAIHPELAFQPAFNEPDSSAPAHAAREQLTAAEESHRRVRWINKPQFPSPCQFTLSGHLGEVNTCDISPDGKRIVSASSDHQLKIWDADNGKELFTLRGHQDSVEASGKQLSVLLAHESDVLSLAFVPTDESRLVSCSWDRTRKIWDLELVPIVEAMPTGTSEQGLRIEVDPLPLQGPLLSCSRSSNGKLYVAGTFDGRLRLWDAENGSDLGSFEVHPKDYIVGCPFSPDGKWILAAGWNGPLKLFDISKNQERPPIGDHESQILSCGFSSDGKRVFSCSAEQIGVWNFSPTSVEMQRQWLKASEPFQTCVISPDGSWIIVGTQVGALDLREVSTGKQENFTSGHPGLQYSALSPDGTRFVTGSDNGSLKIWDVASRAELITLRGHTNKVQSCVFSPNGQRIASGSYDRTVKVWKLADPTEPITLVGHTESLQDVCFSADGAKVLSVATDGTFRLWDSKSGLPLGRQVSTSNPATRAAIRVGTFDFFDAAALWSW
jgi:WD40 repeat protein